MQPCIRTSMHAAPAGTPVTRRNRPSSPLLIVSSEVASAHRNRSGQKLHQRRRPATGIDHPVAGLFTSLTYICIFTSPPLATSFTSSISHLSQRALSRPGPNGAARAHPLSTSISGILPHRRRDALQDHGHSACIKGGEVDPRRQEGFPRCRTNQKLLLGLDC